MKTSSGKLSAFLFLKTNGVIERATDAKYLECVGGNHVFRLLDGRICSVDLVIGKLTYQEN